MAAASEAGYHGYARLRDRYWKELDAYQHADARARTRELRAEYGDSTALPRLQRSIRMARHEATGSRLGYTGVLEVTSIDGNRDGRGPSLSGADYYDARYWRSMQPTAKDAAWAADRSEEHTSELQSLMRIS